MALPLGPVSSASSASAESSVNNSLADVPIAEAVSDLSLSYPWYLSDGVVAVYLA